MKRTPCNRANVSAGEVSLKRIAFLSMVLVCLLLCDAGLGEPPQQTPSPPPDQERPIELIRADAIREALRALDPADCAGSIDSLDGAFDVYLAEGHAPLNLPYADTDVIRFHTVDYSLRQLYDLQFALGPLHEKGVRVTRTNVRENRVDICASDSSAELEARIAALCPDRDMYAVLTPGEEESDGAYLARDEDGGVPRDQRTTFLVQQAMEALGGLIQFEYGGLSDSDNMRVLNVNILKTDAGVADLLPDAPDVVRIHEAEYSQAELRQLQAAMGERMEEFGIYLLYVDIADNRVVIGLLNETDEVLEKLHSEFPDTGMYAVKEQERDWRERKEVSPYEPERLNGGVELLLDKPCYPENEVTLNITLKNHTDRVFGHGDLFYLEIRHEEVWYVIPIINAMSDLVGYGLRANGEEHFERDLARQYGILAPGHYRLIMDFGGDGYAYAEFDIEPPMDKR